MGALASCLVHTYLLQATLLDIPLDGVEIEITGGLDMTGVVGLPADKPIRLALAQHLRAASGVDQGEIEGLHTVGIAAVAAAELDAAFGQPHGFAVGRRGVVDVRQHGLELRIDGQPSVEVGQSITCGDQLGIVGSSGYSSGPHLHFEVQHADETVIDPYAGVNSQPETWWVDQGDPEGFPSGDCP